MHVCITEICKYSKSVPILTHNIRSVVFRFCYRGHGRMISRSCLTSTSVCVCVDNAPNCVYLTYGEKTCAHPTMVKCVSPHQRPRMHEMMIIIVFDYVECVRCWCFHQYLHVHMLVVRLSIRFGRFGSLSGSAREKKTYVKVNLPIKHDIELYWRRSVFGGM